MSKIATGAILEEQEDVLGVLECEVELHNEVALGEAGKYVSFCLCVPRQLLFIDDLFVDDFHCKLLASKWTVWVNSCV